MSDGAYEAFAKRVTAGGIITDPWLHGQPRLREEPVILGAARAKEMERAAESIAEVYNELCMIVADHEDFLDSFFGLTGWQKAMWLASQPMWHGLARADVFITSEGLQIAELNCDTPTGEAEAVVLGEITKRADCNNPNEGLVARIVDVAEALAPRGRKRVAGLVYPTELPEDLSLVRLYQRAFGARGWEIVLGSPFNLEHDGEALTLFDRELALVIRHYKTDWWGERESAWLDEALPDPAPLDQPLAAVMKALHDGTCAVLNPFGAVVPQNKRAMAFMWEHIHRFSRRAQGIIRELVPHSRRLEAIHLEQVIAQKDQWVLKSDYGAEGDEVVIGKQCTPEEWKNALSLARPSRWIVQQYFEAETNAAGETVNYGVFVIAGEAAGLYARVQKGATDEHALSAPLLVSC